MNKMGLIKDLRERKEKAESTYYTSKHNIIGGSSSNIEEDFEKMSEALWEMERINNVLLEQEHADRRLIEELHRDILEKDPHEIVEPTSDDELIDGKWLIDGEDDEELLKS